MELSSRFLFTPTQTDLLCHSSDHTSRFAVRGEAEGKELMLNDSMPFRIIPDDEIRRGTVGIVLTLFGLHLRSPVDLMQHRFGRHPHLDLELIADEMVKHARFSALEIPLSLHPWDRTSPPGRPCRFRANNGQPTLIGGSLPISSIASGLGT
jgi:hypothetical protein